MMSSGAVDTSSNYHGEGVGREEIQRISVSDHINGLQHTSMKSESFVVDMDRFTHLIEKDGNANSRFTRNLSRKGSGRGGEKKLSPAMANEKDPSTLTSSPKATLHGSNSTLEKVTLGPADPASPQVHHHITIANGTATTIATENLLGTRQSSFRRSQSSWIISPRRILLFFATLSSMGTILLIYFTLSMAKMNEDGAALDQ